MTAKPSEGTVEAVRRFASLLETDGTRLATQCEDVLPEAGQVFEAVVARVRAPRAASGACEHFARWAVQRLADEPELVEPFAVAMGCLNDTLVARARERERRRIARELHDRLGEELTVALRRVELQSLRGTGEADVAVRAIAAGMDRLREIIAELAPEPVTDLWAALRDHVTALSDPRVVLRMSGDGANAPPEVLTEAFYVLRQAVRNAIAHGDPSRIVIEVHMGTRLLRGLVRDDGRGFTGGPGIGITSMRERAAAVGGHVLIDGGHGTCVELRVPLC